jgi:hypothetical protein
MVRRAWGRDHSSTQMFCQLDGKARDTARSTLPIARRGTPYRLTRDPCSRMWEKQGRRLGIYSSIQQRINGRLVSPTKFPFFILRAVLA